MEESEVEKIKVGAGAALYVWGIVTYSDVFGESHYTKFCQLITWGSKDTIWATYIARFSEAT